MSLQNEIENWDAKSASQISEIYRRHRDVPEFLDTLVRLLDHEPAQRGATWLLKHYFDEGGEGLGETLAERLYESLPELVHWESRLHVLQIMEHVPIPKSKEQSTHAFLKTNLHDDNKFVRAWAYNGLHCLANQFPDHRLETDQVLERALLEETAGSVLSRVRRVLKRGYS